ncbi:MAG TPA: GyrI-like domain-containing protein [Ktedonobacterales bacterium]
MSNLMPIGRFSQACRLTVKALRHYDELGLLAPAWVDDESGFRYYAPEQVATAQTIRLLRELEMPLPEIRALLCASDPASRQMVLREHRLRLQERISGYQQAVAGIDLLLRQQEQATPAYDVRIKSVAPQSIAGVRVQVPQSALSTVIPRTTAELRRYLRDVGIAPAGHSVVLYHELEEGADESDNPILDAEIAISVPASVPENDCIHNSQVQGGDVAYLIHIGPYSQIPFAYGPLSAWIQEHGHEYAGPAREVYLTNPIEEPDPAKYQTEIAWPIR